MPQMMPIAWFNMALITMTMVWVVASALFFMATNKATSTQEKTYSNPLSWKW